MSTDPYPYLSDNVKRQIAAGEVPPPRKVTETADPVRDIKLAIAVAQDNDDGEAVARLQAEWLTALRNGAVSTWEPPAKPKGRDVTKPHTRDELLHAARKASEDGDDQRAHVLKVQAMHAPNADAAKLLHDSNSLDAARVDQAGSERLKVEALRKLRGELPPPEPIPMPRQPQTVPELNAAIAQAEADGDLAAANRHRVGLLALNRAARDGGSIDLQ